MYKHYKYNSQLPTLAFFLADSEVSTLFKTSEETNTFLKQMMEQMNKLQEQVNTLQSKQSTSTVLYHMRILYHTRMVHTICVYAYGTTIRVWYGKSYHLSIANLVCVQYQAEGFCTAVPIDYV